MRKLALGCVVVLALAAAAVAFAARSASTETTIRVIEHANTDAVTDIGRSGDSVGDVLTFANPLFTKTDKARTGSDQGFCVRVVVGVAWECWWTAKLAGGQLTVDGPFYDKKSSRLAVTGGTGAYADARG